MTRNRALLIAGPTASGKSALALRLAEAFHNRGGAAIVNADSMQVYRDLRILTARPTPADEARAPHYLYGFRAADAPCSAGEWAQLAAAAIAGICATGRLPILVGGAGLYFRALTQGIAPIPDIDPDIRAAALAAFQAQPAPPLFTGSMLRFVLSGPRQWLCTRCDARVDAMLAAGALDEVAALESLVRQQGLSGDLPILRAVGVPGFRALLRGEISAGQAALQAKTETRQYAKRQLTWIRNQMIAWNRFDTQDSERIFDEIFSFILKSDLTD